MRKGYQQQKCPAKPIVKRFGTFSSDDCYAGVTYSFFPPEK
jgi:hypothetical protein